MENFDPWKKGKNLFCGYLNFFVWVLGMPCSEGSFQKINLKIECNIDENQEIPEARFPSRHSYKNIN